jgi:translation elongation factor EF-G
VPEDANGKLQTQTQEFTAEVISVYVDVIRIRLRGEAMPENVDRAELIIDEIGLLRRLIEVLAQPADHGFNFGELSWKVFHPAQCSVGSADLPDAINSEELGEKRAVLRQALGSNVTFVWGPPGTGKTFVIARLITGLVRAGERVLVTSHTKAAVDQALYEATKESAPLANSPEVSAGQILRIGIVPENSDLPSSVRLEDVLEGRTKELREQKAELETRAKPLRDRKVYLESVLGCWNNLTLLAAKTRDIPSKIEEAKHQIQFANKNSSQAERNISARENALRAAQRAWFGRTNKVTRATTELANARTLKNATR